MFDITERGAYSAPRSIYRPPALRQEIKYPREEKPLNLELLEQAKARVPSIPVLVNMVSKRVRQLNAGYRPYVKPSSPDEERTDIALREIAEGAIIAEMNFSTTPNEGEEKI